MTLLITFTTQIFEKAVMDMKDAFEQSNCLIRLRGLLPSLRPSEQKVASYILSHPEKVVYLSITELSQIVGVSDAAIVKFAQRIGYKGYQDLKINLAQELPQTGEPVYGEIELDDSISEVKEKLFHVNIAALQDTQEVLDDGALEAAIDAMLGAQRIDFYGLGASGIVAQDAQHKFLRIGLNCNAYIDTHMQAAMAALLKKGDVAVGISHSGQTKDIVSAIAIANAAGATTICITNYPASQIAQEAKIKLFTSSRETTLRSGAIASRIAQLSVIDVLYIGVVLRKYDLVMDCLEKTRKAVADKRF
ncbi:MAG: MurR/RpiR family transcriptional regulator [Firmicutes bacterium]|nr:MurR/RpiR family transcriptional regulator [Bacillota bacterium]